MVGEFKDDRIQTHKHYILGEPVPRGGGANLIELNETGSKYYKTSDIISSTARNGDTTRVKSKGVKYIVKVL